MSTALTRLIGRGTSAEDAEVERLAGTLAAQAQDDDVVDPADDPEPAADPVEEPEDEPEDEPATLLADESDDARNARASERERCKAIITSEHAKGRVALAHHLAFGTELTAAQAVAALEQSPKIQGRGRLSEQMATVRQPDVGPGAPADGGGETVEAVSDGLAALAQPRRG